MIRTTFNTKNGSIAMLSGNIGNNQIAYIPPQLKVGDSVHVNFNGEMMLEGTIIPFKNVNGETVDYERKYSHKTDGFHFGSQDSIVWYCNSYRVMTERGSITLLETDLLEWNYIEPNFGMVRSFISGSLEIFKDFIDKIEPMEVIPDTFPKLRGFVERHEQEPDAENHDPFYHAFRDVIDGLFKDDED